MDTAALKSSWDEVAAQGDEVPLFFYSHLFLAHPELRSMFPVAMSGQRDKLVSALGRMVSHVDDLPEVTSFIQQLGRDHRRFSVVTGHYGAVGSSLLVTLKHFLGTRWTKGLAEDWAAAYGVIARVMVEAAEDSEDTAPAWWEAEVVETERRTMDVTVLSILPQQQYDYLPGQSFAVDGGQVSGTLVRSVQAGETLKLGAPVGDRLTLRDDDRDLMLVAGGTGLAPLRAVVDQLDQDWQAGRPVPQVHLFHGARVPWNLYDRDRMRELVGSRPWLDYTEVVSDDPSYPGVRGPVGSVAASTGPWHGRTALVCGGPQMVAHTIEQLVGAGMPVEHIRYEQFDDVGAGDTAVAVAVGTGESK